MRDESPPVTAVQRSYLEAFERLLRSRDQDSARRARLDVAERFEGVMAEARVPPPNYARWGPSWSDP